MTEQASSQFGEAVWRCSRWHWWLFVLLIAFLIGAFFDGVALMVQWWQRPEYSHGYLIPLVTCYLIWHRRSRIRQVPFRASWLGVAAVIGGLMLGILGELSALYTVVQYGFLLALWGIVLAVVGKQAFREMWIPLLFLVFMIPLPNFVYNNVSAELQLVSSQIGVALIRAFDVAVHLDGNVIDLGSYQLQVVDACAGLRYLFPLMSLAFLAAYLYKGHLWQKAVLFLSSVPITILMNSIRIGVIGLLVEHRGVQMAEGFLHYLEGWVVFMICFAILMGEIALFAALSKPRRDMRAALGLDVMSLAAPRAPSMRRQRVLPISALVAGSLLMAGFAGASVLEERYETLPDRRDFVDFPLIVGEWRGWPQGLEQRFIDELKFDDYAMVQYANDVGEWVEFYAAYYSSQRKGQSAHSPRSCIPGGGWKIKSLDEVTLDGVAVSGEALRVNRVYIEKGDQRQLVYYWFQQRGRVITNEYAVKWYLFWDALVRNRSDGALVRLSARIDAVNDVADVDRRLRNFAAAVVADLEKHIPT